MKVRTDMADVLVRALSGQRPLRPVTPDELRMVVLVLTELEGKLDDAVERLYLSEYALDAGQLMGAARLIADVKKDLEGELPKEPVASDDTPDHCPSCGIPLVLKNPDDPAGPAECPHCNFQAPAYPVKPA